jgi:hypothetical protein
MLWINVCGESRIFKESSAPSEKTLSRLGPPGFWKTMLSEFNCYLPLKIRIVP